MQPFEYEGVTLEISTEGRWRYERPTPALRVISKVIKASNNPGHFALTLYGVTPDSHEGPLPHVTSELDPENRVARLVVRTGRAPGDGIVCSIRLPKTRFAEPKTFVKDIADATNRLMSASWNESKLLREPPTAETGTGQEHDSRVAGSTNQLATKALMRYVGRVPPRNEDSCETPLPQDASPVRSDEPAPEAPEGETSAESAPVPEPPQARTKRSKNSRATTPTRQREESPPSRTAIISQLETCVVQLRREKAMLGRERMRVVELEKALGHVSGVLGSDPSLSNATSQRVVKAIHTGQRDFIARAHNLARDIERIEQGIHTATHTIGLLKKTFEDLLKTKFTA